jgi:hypothetical protein
MNEYFGNPEHRIIEVNNIGIKIPYENISIPPNKM